MEGDLPQDDGLKWFGEGFDGFPKRLPDDCVEYVIYVIDEKLKDLAATRSRLKEISKVANEILKENTKDYIWQRDAFDLNLRPSLEETIETKAQTTPHLRGRTDFGDSVADEWLIVYLLLELSKQCPEIWIRVYDTDGEFLLIEAANSLPKWLNPEIAENRVWINDGRLRIIPLSDSDSSRNLSLQEALEFFRGSRDKMIKSPEIENEAFYRLKGYPDAIKESLHHSLVTIPRRLAYLLHHNPAYISAAVEAFYLRDPISLKPLATKDLSTLTFPPEDFVEYQDKRGVREMKILLEDVESGEESLPTDSEMQSWPLVEDDEKWLDIDYNDFEDELAGKNGKATGKGMGKGGAGGDGDAEGGKGFGDKGAQDNLRKMVSRFEDFLNDDEAGAEGVDDDDIDDDDEDDDSDSVSDGDGSTGSDGEDKEGSFEEAEFERAMREMMGMPGTMVEESGLLDEARKLALDDEVEGEEVDEDEEMKKVMELMERELKGHGALNIDKDEEEGGKGRGRDKGKVVQKSAERAVESKVMFGPERPPNMQRPQVEDEDEDSEIEVLEDDDDVGPGDGELSSDDEEHNDIDLGLAKNMLEAFKGQAGMQGPAGNLMRALGVQMPRDEDGGPM
ncbi:hypothetical protein LTR56_010926 [Elasticomyces elasticus]|nr:hypothetical protein LTR56_010926 [Elasticomyces elasticus]KAK3662625.1 hypothetical protein LTR22_006475 [Elasticomyces elasticus]KAK4926591.1 hypothetical protein LTR49_006525 [Elasticomyces elasticus]KAK5760684.1 hypothetical protein LTS12_009221 [Elasticomyces elasticus]